MTTRGGATGPLPSNVSGGPSTSSNTGNKKEKGLKQDLVRIVYGYGDEKEPMKESIDLLDNMVHEYIGEMCQQVSECRCTDRLSKTAESLGL